MIFCVENKNDNITYTITSKKLCQTHYLLISIIVNAILII